MRKKPTHKTESYYLSLLNIKWLKAMGRKGSEAKSASAYLDSVITEAREAKENE